MRSYTTRDRGFQPRKIKLWKPSGPYLGILIVDKDKRSVTPRTQLGIFLTISATRQLIVAMTKMCDEIEEGR